MMHFRRQNHKARKMKATRRDLIMQRWNVIQHELLPELSNDVGTLTPKLEKVIHTLEWVRIEEFVSSTWCGEGRPPHERSWLANAFVAAVSLTEENRPLRVRLTPVSGFTSKAVLAWAKGNVAPGSAVFSDGLACFGAVVGAGCMHHPTVMAGRKPKVVPEFKWINTVLGNLKTSLSGCYHAFDFPKYAARYLAAFCYRFNRRFDLRTLHQRLLIAAVTAIPRPLRLIRVADVRC